MKSSHALEFQLIPLDKKEERTMATAYALANAAERAKERGDSN
jgi:hypothetical protein